MVQADLRQTIQLDIAGLPLALSTDSAWIAAAARARFGATGQAAENPPLLLTHVLPEAEPLVQRPAPELAIEGRLVRIAGGGFEGCADLGTRHAEVRVGPTNSGIALENYLRVVTAILILERGGVLLHSSAAVRAGEGFVFFGPSDAGKSTVALLSHGLGYPVLSDDQNVLYPSDEGVLVHSVPFRGGQCPVPTRAGIAPLRRLLYLRKDAQVGLELIPRPVGVALLSTQVPLVNWQPSLADLVLANCTEIARRVPVEILHFRRDAAFWQIL